MASRTSAALLAALIAAAPAGLALAQTTPATPVADAAGAAAEAAGNAADAAGEAAKSAADAAGDAAKSAADAASAAADSAAKAAGAAAETVTGAPAAETPAEAPAAETPAATETPAAPAAEAPAAAEAAAAPTAPEYYAKSTHGDWQLRCMKSPDGKDPCELYQLLKDDRGTPVSEVSLVPFSGQAAAIVNIVAPLQTDLQAGLGLQVDAGANNAYPFLVCAPVGCVARIGLKDSELSGYKRGNKVTVSLLPFGADPATDVVKLNMSLKGFTAGFDALSQVVRDTQAEAPAAPAAQ